MCCIIYKPKGVQMPTLDTLNKVQRINHHGYGFVSSKHRYKTMDYQKFWFIFQRWVLKKNVSFT